MHRSLRISAALFWFFWACVIVPGHTRGVVRLDGKETQARCCDTPASKHSKPVPASKTCAICFVSAKVSKQTVAPLAALKLPFAYTAAPPKAFEAATVQTILPFHTRGPPDSSTANT